ncbi:MAG: hypothetical protein KME05_02905 [Gloeocapsa sp. UFS-A4-WI-NPMV-4B04]|jgi:ATP-dependent Clp protease ATP-binding subunit ClpA|nr:hypothetical protein [Gloeocapsa sp. UFS-A4-WI-NPMV-4B04]
MFDFKNFSERSLKVIHLAQEESHRLGHNFLGSEQLLIGLLSADNSTTQLLKAEGITLEATQLEVEKIIGRGAGFVAMEIPSTARARRAIKTAMAIAREQGIIIVEPEHLLLAIIDLGEGLSLRVLENLSISVPQLREATLNQIQSLPQQAPPQPVREPETQTSSLLPVIPPVGRTAPRMLMNVITLPQETGRWVAEVNASGSVLDGPNFRSIGYGDTDYSAIAQALESLARMYRDYKA